MIVPHVGGGFGGKAGIHLEPLLACLSRKAGGRPVRLQATREEEFSLLPCRSALTYRIKTGVARRRQDHRPADDDVLGRGRLRRLRRQRHPRVGLLGSGSLRDSQRAVDAYTIYTNKPYGTAYRGFGHVEFFWGLERHMELVAQAIGMDSLEFRKQNLLRPGSTTLTGEIDHRAHRRPPASVWSEAAGGHRLRPADPGGGRARAAHRPQDRQGRCHAAQGAGDAVLHRPTAARGQDELRRLGRA